MRELYPYAPLLLAFTLVIVIATVGAVVTLVLMSRRDLRRALSALNTNRNNGAKQIMENAEKIKKLDGRLKLVEEDTQAIKQSREDFAVAAKGIQQVKTALEALPSWIYTMKLVGEGEKKIS